MATKKEINRRLIEIEKEIDKLKEEKQQLLKMRQELKHREQIEEPKIYLRKIKDKYIVANARVKNKVETIYLGSERNLPNWRTSKKVKTEAINKMKEKLLRNAKKEYPK